MGGREGVEVDNHWSDRGAMFIAYGVAPAGVSNCWNNRHSAAASLRLSLTQSRPAGIVAEMH